MKILFAETVNEHCGASGWFAGLKSNHSRAQSVSRVSRKVTGIQLELSEDTLRRLILENRLVAEEFSCLNPKSKKIVRQLFLESLQY